MSDSTSDSKLEYGKNKLKRLHAVPLEDGKVIVKVGTSAIDIYFKNVNRFNLPESFLLSSQDKLMLVLIEYVQEWKNIKTNLLLECTFNKIKIYHGENNEQMGGEEIINANFKTKNEEVSEATDIETYLIQCFQRIISEIDDFEFKGSGWSLKSIDGVLIRITKYTPLTAKCFFTLPHKLKISKSIINVQNNDNYCFKYAILSWYLKTSTNGIAQKNLHRVSKYNKLIHPYNFEGVNFPATFKDIAWFEKHNSVSVNVYGLSGGTDELKIYPLKVSMKVNLGLPTIDLLYLENTHHSHYCYISNLPSLVNSQLYKVPNRSIIMCRNCFKAYRKTIIYTTGETAEERLEQHKIFCNRFKPCRYEFPKKNSIEFNDYQFMTKVGFVIYADLECILQPLNTKSSNMDESVDLENDISAVPKTKPIDLHTPMCVGFHLKSYYPELKEDETFIFSSENCVYRFLAELREQVLKIEKCYETKVQCSMTDNEKLKHDAATHCELCGIEFSETNIKCADHDHASGLFRFTCCSFCNLQKLKKPSFIPIFFHNLSAYDAHFIVKNLSLFNVKIEVIPQTEEKYISFSIRFEGCKLWCRFLDSFRFLPASLEKLVATCMEFPEMEKNFHDSELRSLVLRKGIYPYQHITDFSVLQETVLPSRDKFYNKLTNQPVSEVDYKHAHKVWNAFKINNLEEYTILYLKTDIILLCEVFEQFRKLSYDRFQLDSAWFFTSPGFSFKAALKVSKIKLEILTDIDMIQFVESGIRGGITQSVKRYAVANNIHLPETYNPYKDSSYIFYGDVNNLYGWAMSQSLPFGHFVWLTEFENLNVMEIETGGKYGYILDVNVHYPKHLHNKHSDFPFLPERKKPPGSKVEKLLLDFEDKTNYVVHIAVLQQAIKAGLVLTRINRVLQFQQSKWLSTYINMNTEMRKKAKNDFEKDFFKLLNNAVFGKTMESVRNRINLKLITSEKELVALARKPNFQDRTIFDENLIAVRLANEKIVFNKPFYVGFAILELSKTLIYDLHYEHLLPKFGENAIKICYQDTDSFIWEIKTNNLYNDLKSLSHIFDFSEYPPSHSLYSNKNKKVIGKIKDETNSIPVKEFICLRPKLYSLKFGDNVIKKAKGIGKTAVADLKFEDYLHCLKTKKDLYSNFRKIDSKLHDVFTVDLCKKSLSFHDDKREILEDGIHTKPYHSTV